MNLVDLIGDIELQQDYWNNERTDVVGFIRYHDSGETEYILTGRK